MACLLPNSTIGSAGVKVALLMVRFSSAANVFTSLSEGDREKNISFSVKTPCDVPAYCKTAINTIYHLRFHIHLSTEVLVVPTHNTLGCTCGVFALLSFSFRNYPAVSQW